MKKAEEYFKYLEPYQHLQDTMSNCFINAIRQVQLDAIEETVKLCAENAEIDINGDCDDKFSLRSQDGEWLVIVPNQEAILKCADILKKELE